MLQKILLFCFAFLVQLLLRAQNYDPISVSGFNQDVIAEGTGNSSLNTTTREMDAFIPSNNVMCTRQFAITNGLPSIYGLPNNGTIVSGTKTYQLGALGNGTGTLNNALYLLRNETGTLTFSTPATFISLSFLVLATETNAAADITVNFTDGSNLTFLRKIFLDWYNGANAALTGFGRVKRINGPFGTGTYEMAPVNPRMYSIDVTTPCNKIIASVSFKNVTAGTNPASNRAFVFAISGSPGQKSLSTINKTICAGQTYSGHTTTGTYIDTFATANSCDSIRTLNLVVTPKVSATINQTICEGQTYAGYTTSGTYTNTFAAANGCDSIRTLNLTVIQKSFSIINQTICAGQSYAGHNVAGIYIDTFAVTNGCDSIRTLNLTVKPKSLSTINQTICAGQTYEGHTATGTYIDTFAVANGCDSIRTLNLVVTPKISTTINQTICKGQTYAGHTTGGTYIDTYASTNGCDSIRTLNLIVTPKVFSTINQTICAGQNYSGYSTSGSYADTFVSANGCDSLRTLHLTVLNKPIPDLGLDKELCKGDTLVLNPGRFSSYLWQDFSTFDHFVVRNAGVYSVTVTNACGTNRDEVLISEKNCNIYFPSAFTPNSDGKNDVFRISNAYDLQGYYLTIYNRWGQKVFETKDYTQGWDGKLNSQLQNTGGYVWFCRYKKNGVVINLKGTVALIR